MSRLVFKNRNLQKLLTRMVILLLLSLFICCSRIKKEFDITCNEVTHSEADIITQWCLSIQKDEKSYSYLYTENIDTSNWYKFETSFDNNTNRTIIISQNDTSYLDLIQKRNWTINKKRYTIYTFRYYNHELEAVDSSIVFFITKEFGVINAINRAWEYKFIINFSDKKSRKIVEELNQIIMGDTIYYWHDNNFPPFPN